jgi:transposase
MSEAYIGALNEHYPNATLVLDRFHVVKALNEAVDDVRKEQWREAGADERKALKGLRWLLYRHSSTRSRKDTATLKALEKANRRIYRAWRLKDEFEQFWEYNATWAAERFIKRWMTAALKSRLEPMRKFVGTLRRHYAGVIAFIDTQLTNAVAEGLNRIVKIVKNRASGFRTLSAFADMIFLTVGDVDIPGQISTKFRTL